MASDLMGDTSPTRTDQPDQRTVRRAVATASLGNAVEWFDFGVYSYLATTLGTVFFPETDKAGQLLSVFGVLAASFICRPLGGWIFGSLGDRIGRRRTLSITILFMSAATFGIGLIPDYSVIGIGAPILLVLCRIVQGFSTGGEWGGAATFISEYAPHHRRARLGSCLELGTLLGLASGGALATLITAATSNEQLTTWGWRIPFLIAGPLGIVGLYLRLRLHDTPEFHKARRDQRVTATPLRDAVTRHLSAIVKLIGIIVLVNIADYTLLSYMPSYFSTTLHISDTRALVIVLLIMAAMIGLIYPVGKLADRIGNRPLLTTACVGHIILAIPAVLLMNTKTIPGVVAGVAVLGILLVLMLGTVPSIVPRMFPTPVRYVAVAVGFNVSTAVFGGTAPLMQEALIGATGSNLIPGIYLCGAALVALIPVLKTAETAGAPHGTSKPESEIF